MPAPKSKPAAWAESTWRGMTRYACAACAFDSLDAAAIADHVRDAHPAADAYRGAPEPKEDAPAARPVAHTDGSAENAVN